MSVEAFFIIGEHPFGEHPFAIILKTDGTLVVRSETPDLVLRSGTSLEDGLRLSPTRLGDWPPIAAESKNFKATFRVRIDLTGKHYNASVMITSTTYPTGITPFAVSLRPTPPPQVVSIRGKRADITRKKRKMRGESRSEVDGPPLASRNDGS